jgi:hypothetical protein
MTGFRSDGRPRESRWRTKACVSWVWFFYGLALPVAVWGADLKPDFNRDIRPILSENCFACHGPDAAARKAGLRLDLADEAYKPAKSGVTAIVPGKPEDSELIKRITWTNKNRIMPPASTEKKLSTNQVELLRRWIQSGAEYRLHWSFIPPYRPSLPAVKAQSWVRNPIDVFVLSRLESAGLAPSLEAERRMLIRRLSFDLTGLPPKPTEVAEFLTDERSDAYERLVDRLLASPHYGERMAVEWLDAARFADTHGYHIDSGRDMTHWRDWVIQSYNSNQSFDAFTIQQLAGDLLPEATRDQKIASGFNRNHMINFEGGAIPEEYQTAYVMDRVNTTTRVWLGLTVACAQCHDHKYDPITQKDYYRLYAFFNRVPENGLDGQKGNAAPMLALSTPAQEEELKRLKGEVSAEQARVQELEPELKVRQLGWETGVLMKKQEIGRVVEIAPEQRTKDQQEELDRYFRETQAPDWQLAQARVNDAQQRLEDYQKTIPSTMVMEEMHNPRDTFVLGRGQYDKPGEKVTPGIPASLGTFSPDLPVNRLGLARWLVSREQPLTARVIVNRYWQMYFGTGLVKTAEDFGSQGEWPSHPELLDWLAVEFIESGWDVKAMQRLIVLSSTYRQSSRVTGDLAARDPENRWLARGSRLRLQAEFIRDNALAISGLLDRRIGGASVSPYQPPGLWEELASREDGKKWTAQTYTQSHRSDLYRRTMYTFWKRSSPPPTLTTFDAPDREICTVKRPRTNTPLQALVLLNDPTYIEAARKLAEHLLTEARTDEDRLELAFQLTLSRSPEAREKALLLKLLQEQLSTYDRDEAAARALLAVGESPWQEQHSPSMLAAWAILANVILNLDEFITKS